MPVLLRACTHERVLLLPNVHKSRFASYFSSDRAFLRPKTTTIQRRPSKLGLPPRPRYKLTRRLGGKTCHQKNRSRTAAITGAGEPPTGAGLDYFRQFTFITPSSSRSLASSFPNLASVIHLSPRLLSPHFCLHSCGGLPLPFGCTRRPSPSSYHMLSLGYLGLVDFSVRLNFGDLRLLRHALNDRLGQRLAVRTTPLP